MPLIVVEKDSALEVRDSLLRSARNDSNLDKSGSIEDRSDWTYKKDLSVGSYGNYNRDSLGKRDSG